VTKATPEPERITTPPSGMPPAEPPAENTDEFPEPETSKMPEIPAEPGPNPDEPDMAPAPPSGVEPAVPPGVNDNAPGKPSEDLDDLFPDEKPAAKDGSNEDSKGDSMDDSTDEPKDESQDKSKDESPATDDASPEGTSKEAMPQGRRGGGRRASFNSTSTDSKMHWRRSSRLASVAGSDSRIASDDGHVAPVGRGATQSPWQEVTPATSTERSVLNPLRGSRNILPASGTQSPSLAETGVVPAVADWQAASLSGSSSSSRANPLRGGQ
jgi:hypothetical protein